MEDAPTSRVTGARKRRVTITAVLTVALLGAGVAFAAWLVSGTGPATSQATTAVSLTVTAGTPTASLYPKPTAGYPNTTIGAVYANVQNSNPFPVKITGATFGTITVAPLSGRTCAASWITAPAPVTLATPVTVPANSTAGVTVPGALEMNANAETGCQGATFTVQTTLSGESA
jgi:hypothetical protein